MTELPPLKRMNPKTVIEDLFAQLGEPAPGPLKRMSKRQVLDMANAVIVENGGEELPRGSSFADVAAELKIVYEGLEPAEGGGGEPENALQLGGESLQLGGETLTLGA